MNEGDEDFSEFSLLDLFRSEADTQLKVLTEGLLALERDADSLSRIEPLMRAAHSLKGAARIVNLEPIERLAHAMEDCFVAAQKGKLQLNKARIDRLLAGVDLMSEIAALDESVATTWLEENKLKIGTLLVSIHDAADPSKLTAEPPASAPALAAEPAAQERRAEPDAVRDEQVLKVSVRHFDRLLSLASESRVAAHAMRTHLQSLQLFKKRQHELFLELEKQLQTLTGSVIDDALKERLLSTRQRIDPLRNTLISHLADLDAYERRLLSLTQDMLDEVLVLRMRPFQDGVHAFPRMVRDLAHRLGKQARLDIVGADTLVDRDVLVRMEAPLNQLLRNAIDHGLETPEERIAAGKPAEGRIRLEARHTAGMLAIQVSDDGRGVDLERVRRKVVERGMATAEMAAAMSAGELLDFLMLPAFSLKETTSEVSGRGVGLDVVHATVRQLYGSVRLSTESGNGFHTHITLPLSQSVVRVVIADVAGEAYAVPISKIERIMRVPLEEIYTLENRQFFTLGGEHIGVIAAAQLLELGAPQAPVGGLPVIIIGTAAKRYALAVDAIRGEQSLTVQPIDAIFGKMRDISAAALLDDGSPVLILDIADLLVSIDKLISEGSLQGMNAGSIGTAKKAKRILVVDDSLTVREMERKLLQARGFIVDVAVDGMDGWNAVRSNDYHLVITDVDMPRMDGIELVQLIKRDNRLQNLPVMIVSYKDRPEDRARGIDAGADYYLTKGSFHDDSLLEAVHDLIGDSVS